MRQDAGENSISEVIDLYKRDVDASLLRSRLALSPEDRLRDVMRMQRAIEELRASARAARGTGP